MSNFSRTGHMRLTFLLLIVSVPVICVWGNNDELQSTDLDKTLHIIIKNNHHRISLIKKSHNDLLVEKSRLLNNAALNVAPVVSVGRDGVTTLLCGEFDIRDFSTYFDVSPLGDNYHNTGGVMLPLVASRRKKAAILDSLLSIERYKANYQVEKLILDELKELWYQIIEIKRIENEIGIRKKIDLKIDSTGRFLSVYVKAGVIHRRSIDRFRMTFTENHLQIAFLEKRLDLLRNRLQYRFQISDDLMGSVLEENRNLLNFFETMPVISEGDKNILTLNEKIDSLNIEGIRKRESYDTHNEYTLRAGPVFTTPGSLGEMSAGLGLQFSLSFVRHGTNLSDSQCKNCDFTGALVEKTTVPDYSLTDELDEYIQGIEIEIEKSMEELKSGVQYSIYSLNDFYSRLVYAKINTSDLRYAYIGNRVTRIQSLQEIGMRDLLIHHISEF